MSRHRPRRGPWRILCTAAFVAAVVVWVIFLRPQFLGGPAGYVTVNGTSMEPGMRTGDVVLVHRQPSYRRGDVVAYRIPAGQAGAGRIVIHRIAGGSAAAGYILRGDNRDADDLWRPKPGDVVGRQRLRVPALALLSRLVVSPIGLGLLAALAVMVIIATGPQEREERHRDRRRRRASRPLTGGPPSGHRRRRTGRPSAGEPPRVAVVHSQPPPRAAGAVPARPADRHAPSERRRVSSVFLSPRWRARCDFTNADAIAAAARVGNAVSRGARTIDRDRALAAARLGRRRARREP